MNSLALENLRNVFSRTLRYALTDLYVMNILISIARVRVPCEALRRSLADAFLFLFGSSVWQSLMTTHWRYLQCLEPRHWRSSVWHSLNGHTLEVLTLETQTVELQCVAVT